MNYMNINEEDVRKLMFADGFGLDEALAHASDYVKELLGRRRSSPSATKHVERIIYKVCGLRRG